MFSFKHIADDDLPDYDTLNYYTSTDFTSYDEPSQIDKKV